MTDLRPALDAPHAAFGVPALVTLPNRAGYYDPREAVAATVIVLPPRTVEVAVGDGTIVSEVRRTIALRRSQVPSLPQKTQIVVTAGLDAGTYHVDRIELETADEIRALVA